MALPGGPLEICFSFDTTISMTSYVDQVKARLQDMVQKLKSDIPGIKIALFAHGDYFQEIYNNKNAYVTRHVDFTDDVAELCTFIKDSVPTNGGDWEECYELVMKEARETLTWSSGSNRVLVMIGDARPHRPSYYEEEKIDWKEEVRMLLESNIRCYGVYCKTPYSRDMDKNFYKSLSDLGKGSFLELEKFDSIFDFMMAICYREQGEDALFAYEAEVKGRIGGAAKDVHHMLTALKKSVSNASVESLKTPATTSKETSATKTPPHAKGKRAADEKKTPAADEKKQKNAGKRAVKQRRGAQGTRSKPKSSLKCKKSPGPINAGQSAVKRLRRERVPETNFALRYFPWSSWKIVLSKNAKKCLTPVFENKNGKMKATRHMANRIFNGKTQCNALYEFAVRLPGCTKKVVYVKSSSGFASRFWFSTLFPSKSLKKQIDNVIQKQAGEILVRRLVLKKFQKYHDIPTTLKNYDYLWVPADSAKEYRELKNETYIISERMEVD